LAVKVMGGKANRPSAYPGNALAHVLLLRRRQLLHALSAMHWRHYHAVRHGHILTCQGVRQGPIDGSKLRGITRKNKHNVEARSWLLHSEGTHAQTCRLGEGRDRRAASTDSVHHDARSRTDPLLHLSPLGYIRHMRRRPLLSLDIRILER
jgi:hypothetical protein